MSHLGVNILALFYLQVVSIDIPEMDRYVREDKAHNLDILDRFIAELPSKVLHMPRLFYLPSKP